MTIVKDLAEVVATGLVVLHVKINAEVVVKEVVVAGVTLAVIKVVKKLVEEHVIIHAKEIVEITAKGIVKTLLVTAIKHPY